MQPANNNGNGHAHHHGPVRARDLRPFVELLDRWQEQSAANRERRINRARTGQEFEQIADQAICERVMVLRVQTAMRAVERAEANATKGRRRR